MEQYTIEIPGTITKATCELAKQGCGRNGYEYIVTNPQKGDYIISKESRGALGRKQHILFFDGEEFKRFTEKLTKRSHKLITAENAGKFVNAYLAGTWDKTLEEIKEEEITQKIKSLKREIEWYKDYVKDLTEQIDQLQDNILELQKIIAQVYLINEKAGPGSRKKARELMLPELENAGGICGTCGRPVVIGCECEYEEY